MGVKSTHFDYPEALERWLLVTSVVDSKAEQFIKPIDASDAERTARYRDDAMLTNFTARTKAGLVGVAFAREPEVVIPESMDYILEDATPEEWKLSQLAQACVGDTLEAGRSGLLVDFPVRDVSTSAADVDNLGIHARIAKYAASNIINWATQRINGKLVLTMVVLRELTPMLADDGFTWIQDVMFRVLVLTAEGYEQHIYDSHDTLIDIIQPKRGDGSVWREIPFVFIGSENNDTDIDKSPLYDLATLNIGHYRNSADIEEMSRLIGQPTLVIASEYSAEQFNEELHGEAIKVGARQALFLGAGGSATFVQPAESQISDLLMQRKEEQAIMLGARLITPSSGAETAEAARIRHGSEVSVLTTVVSNVSDGITRALEYVAVFENIQDDDISYSINEQFYDDKLDAQAVMAAMQLFDRAIISSETLFNAAKSAKIVDKSKEYDQEVDDIGGEDIGLLGNNDEQQ